MPQLLSVILGLPRNVTWNGKTVTCMTALIDTSITDNPDPLERRFPGNVILCSSQPNSTVTLDL